ncbi:MAG: hypothetical protein IKS07_06265 [Lachnospiraceae bacterium]|nr:hypothetical protein [Lachnospiraceae bacterium]
MKQTTYYLIRGRILGREDAGDEGTEYFLFLNGAWERDKRYVILGYLLGIDPFEPADSPYASGCTDILDEICEITEEEAAELTAERRNKG